MNECVDPRGICFFAHMRLVVTTPHNAVVVTSDEHGALGEFTGLPHADFDSRVISEFGIQRHDFISAVAEGVRGSKVIRTVRGDNDGDIEGRNLDL